MSRTPIPPAVGSSPGRYFSERARLCRVRAIAAEVDDALRAENFDATTVRRFAARATFPDAVKLLRTKLPGTDPIDLLLDRYGTRVRAFRLAMAFHAININPWNSTRTLFNNDDLRRIAASRNKRRARGAREALAALGQCDWRSASRRERAAHVLALVCAERLERAE